MQAAGAPRTIPARRRHSQRSLYLAAAASGLLLLLLVWLLGASSTSPAPSDPGSDASVNAPASTQAAPSDGDAAAAPADSTVLDVVEELPRPGDENSARDSRPAVVVRGTRKGEQLLRRVDPVYPAAARLNRVQGPVVLEASIGIHGFLRHIRVVSGDPLLADSVLDAVKLWQYQTRTSGSRRGETPTRIVVNFQLVTRDTAQKR